MGCCVKEPKENRSVDSFVRRMDILIFVTHADKAITIRELCELVLDANQNTVRACLKDLMSAGYLKRESIWTYIPTDKAKQLFEVKG